MDTQQQGHVDAGGAPAGGPRIRVALVLSNWAHLPEDYQADLAWYHQHLLDEDLGTPEAAEAIGYDASNIGRILRGTYEGNWENVLVSIRNYRRIAERRGTIQQVEIVPNAILRMVGAGLDYALANNSITMVVGESRMGKTSAAQAWRAANNHGTSVYVCCPVIGGVRPLLRRISQAIGGNQSLNTGDMYDQICRSFNRNRILIVDEAHRMLLGSREPRGLEILRDLHDETHCALALLATRRFDGSLRKSAYQFEQLLGRISMPIRLPKSIKRSDWLPILTQYIPQPGKELCDACDAIANAPGRLGILVETLKVASRIASKAKKRLTEEHVWKAMALRKQMMGEEE